jgi:hypothetical protein
MCENLTPDTETLDTLDRHFPRLCPRGCPGGVVRENRVLEGKKSGVARPEGIR